jgi:hypothetical protein
LIFTAAKELSQLSKLKVIGVWGLHEAGGRVPGRLKKRGGEEHAAMDWQMRSSFHEFPELS